MAFQLLTGRAFAEDKLQVDLTAPGLRARTSAAIPVEARFKWESNRILEGRLEMEFHEGNRVLGRYRSGELALTTGEQSFRMLLPPPLTPYNDWQVEVRMRFVADKEVFDLIPSVLFIPTVAEHSLVVGWCAARAAAGEQALGLERSVMLDRFSPQSDPAQRPFLTSLVRFVPEDLPAQPLSYTPFDVVVLTAEAFKQAHDRQLQALARWVKGGGSVCVFVGGGLQPYHLSFLNTLAESPEENPAFQPDSDGNLLPGPPKISRFHSGIGRTVVVTADITANPGADSKPWREAVAFLWKIRARQMRAIAETGQWNNAEVLPSENMQFNPVQYAQQYSTGRRFRGGRRMPVPGPYPTAAQWNSLPGILKGELMPQTVRLIPFGALIGMLVVFVLVIGPADYCLLGLLRRRRFTWLLFPTTSLAFMVATVLMANYYLGSQDQRRSLTVVDIGKDGTPLRWNRCELVFAARDRMAVSEVKDALWSPLNGGMALDNPLGTYTGDDSDRESELPLYDGALPTHYRISESVRQWRPEVSRSLSFEPPPVPLIPNWRAIEQAWPDLPAIRAKLSESKPFNGELCAISTGRSMTADPPALAIVSPSILRALCEGPSSGLLSLVSQVSPTGSGNLEDMASADPDEDAWVLAIVTRSGENIIVYRRFFHGN